MFSQQPGTGVNDNLWAYHEDNRPVPTTLSDRYREIVLKALEEASEAVQYSIYTSNEGEGQVQAGVGLH